MLWIARCGNKSIFIGGCSSCTYLCSELLDIWNWKDHQGMDVHHKYTCVLYCCQTALWPEKHMLSDVEKHVHTCDLCCCQTAFWPEKHLHTWPSLLPNCFLTWKTLTQCDLYSCQTAFWPEKHIHTCDLYSCQTAFWPEKHIHTCDLYCCQAAFWCWKTLTHVTFIAAKLLSDLKDIHTCDLYCCQTAFWPEKRAHTWPL